MRVADIADRLEGFIRDQLLTEEQPEDFTRSTPLFEGGILDSLRLAVLINFVRTELGVEIPYSRVNREDFHDLSTVAEMVAELRAEGA